MFSNIYKNKKVIVTGHTGFKGSWLTTWLIKNGAKVVGISKDIPTNPSMFVELKLKNKIKHYIEDIRNLSKMKKIILTEKPVFLFHLAAQPIVSKSYLDPIESISTNVLGTTNILESLRILNNRCVAIIITSDKAYDNIEQVWGYKEEDKIGGKDIYSGSKGAAELIIKSYFYSFLKHKNCKIKLGIARAGNVIGGGDWGKDRIITDCVKAWSRNQHLKLRSPRSTRPWQHVLEPLSGYLSLGAELYNNKNLHGEAFNFGPKTDQNYTVIDLFNRLCRYWNNKTIYKIENKNNFHEAKLLKLNCDKAFHLLSWYANLDFENTIRFTGQWYYNFYKSKKKMLDMTMEQINEYEVIAKKNSLKWTK